MNEIFKVVYDILKWISNNTGLTYREVNIVVYFIVIPVIFLYLIERISKTNYLKVGFLIIVVLSIIMIPDFEVFSSLLFDKSVIFLNWFKIVGLNYIEASVVICVVIPIIVFGVLIYLKKKK